MARSALCYHCGAFKRDFADKCDSCGFEPREPIEVAKSRVLGMPWSFTVKDEGDVVETGRSIKELEAISVQIKSGTPFEFPEFELNGVLAAYQQAQSTTPLQLVVALVK